MKLKGRRVPVSWWWYWLTWTVLQPGCSIGAGLVVSTLHPRPHRPGLGLLWEAAITPEREADTKLTGEFRAARDARVALSKTGGGRGGGGGSWWSTPLIPLLQPGQQEHMKSLSRWTLALTNDSPGRATRAGTGSSFISGVDKSRLARRGDLATRLIKPNQLLSRFAASPVYFFSSPVLKTLPSSSVVTMTITETTSTTAITPSRVSVLSGSEEPVVFFGSDRVPLLATIPLRPVHYRKREVDESSSLSAEFLPRSQSGSFRHSAGTSSSRNSSSSTDGREGNPELELVEADPTLLALDMKPEGSMGISPATMALQTLESVHLQDDEVAFVDALETNVTSSLGETAFLRCRLRGSAQQQVTWVRRRDWHILTSGLLTYTADARFGVKHIPDTHDWTLEIKYLQKKDDGTYECQVPTKTGALVHVFHLFVAAPQAVILGGGVYHVDVTSSVTLVCVVDNAPTPPQVVFWYHNGTLLVDGRYPAVGSNSNGRGSITTQTTTTASRTMSLLTILDAQDSHTGNYTCTSPNAEPDTTQLFVMRRHEPAAVQRHNSASTQLGQYRLDFFTLACSSMLLVRARHAHI